MTPAPTTPDEATGPAEEPEPTTTATPPTAEAEAAPAAGSTDKASPPQAEPLHGVDPYGTPPYGGPGPWAPAPLVQHPSATPAQGVPVPPAALPAPSSGQIPAPASGTNVSAPATTPPQGTHVPAPAALPAPRAHTDPAPPGDLTQPHTASPWLRYDPWASTPAHEIPHGPKRGARRGRLVVGAIALALISGAAGGLVGAHLEREGTDGTIELPQAPAEKNPRRAPGSIAGIAQRALPGVVTLHVSGGGGESTGTGFVLDKRGHILTNNHVVEGAGDDRPVDVTFHDGQSTKGEVVGTDGGYDLAVVKVSGVSGLAPLPLGNSDSTRIGDPVVAIGAPFDLEGTVTYGIVSATNRPITAGGGPESADTSYVDALQTDAPINPGNSGGPLVDSEGRVIGINSAIKAADEGSELGGEGGSIGLGFAIPVNQGKRVAEQLINKGKATHPVIGVRLDTGYSGDGARVAASDGEGGEPVVRDGPGDKAGIKPGDVITEVDGTAVHSAEELIVKVRSRKPDETLDLTLRREGDERSVRLKLGSADDDE